MRLSVFSFSSLSTFEDLLRVFGAFFEADLPCRGRRNSVLSSEYEDTDLDLCLIRLGYLFEFLERP